METHGIVGDQPLSSLNPCVLCRSYSTACTLRSSTPRPVAIPTMVARIRPDLQLRSAWARLVTYLSGSPTPITATLLLVHPTLGTTTAYMVSCAACTESSRHQRNPRSITAALVSGTAALVSGTATRRWLPL